MKIREYSEADLEELRRLHRVEQMPYQFPNLASPIFLTRAVLEEDGRLLAAAFLRLTAEAYLLIDGRNGRPRERWRRLLILHEAVRGEAARRGLDDVHCWLPPGIASSFGRRLNRLGWSRETWDCYSRGVLAATPGLESENPGRREEQDLEGRNGTRIHGNAPAD